MVLELGCEAEMEGHVSGQNGADDQLPDLLCQHINSCQVTVSDKTFLKLSWSRKIRLNMVGVHLTINHQIHIKWALQHHLYIWHANWLPGMQIGSLQYNLTAPAQEAATAQQVTSEPRPGICIGPFDRMVQKRHVNTVTTATQHVTRIVDRVAQDQHFTVNHC